MSRASSALLPSSQTNDRTARFGRTASAQTKIRSAAAIPLLRRRAGLPNRGVPSSGVVIANRAANDLRDRRCVGPGAKPPATEHEREQAGDRESLHMVAGE